MVSAILLAHLKSAIRVTFELEYVYLLDICIRYVCLQLYTCCPRHCALPVALSSSPATGLTVGSNRSAVYIALKKFLMCASAHRSAALCATCRHLQGRCQRLNITSNLLALYISMIIRMKRDSCAIFAGPRHCEVPVPLTGAAAVQAPAGRLAQSLLPMMCHMRCKEDKLYLS